MTNKEKRFAVLIGCAIFAVFADKLPAQAEPLMPKV